MNLNQRNQALMLTEEIMRTYYCKRDIHAVLNHMAPDATWIGPGEREKVYSLDEMRTYFKLAEDAVPSCEVSDPDLHVVDLGTELCLVTGSFTIRTTPESKLILEVDQRVSFTYRLTDETLQVVHMHISNPYGEMKREEYFPNEVGSQSYQYLQRLLREKTEVLNMINGNITGGLKGSNDDDMYSYFYVNEGLPRMLDFTYEEFMEKTGGTAVGAVYPPDLPAALADCVRCFSKGFVYSTEYRMEKKDGSLIWVLDSGRKALDAEGIMRINSIVTDITPLKNALFDLEVERERYRIALDNITGSMCEYDITKDLFTVYQQTEFKKEHHVEKIQFSHFSVSVRSGELVHPEDSEAFLDLCTGRHSGLLEFRTRFFHSDMTWRWNEFNCSVISDTTGTPLRSFGILKDITEETKTKLELLNQAKRDGLTQLFNQTASKEAIQTYLAEDHAPKERQNALLIIDLDHFKEVNDSHGHLYGNEVLVKTARILTDAAGPNSIVGRIGGDEFIILLKDSNPDTASCVASEIIHRVNNIGTEISFSISCSVGIAWQNKCYESYSELFRRADKALYLAKDSGRNQFSMESATPNS